MFDSALGSIVGLWAIQPLNPGSPVSVRGGPSCAMGLKLDQSLVGVSLSLFFRFIFICIGVLPACMSV